MNITTIALFGYVLVSTAIAAFFISDEMNFKNPNYRLVILMSVFWPITIPASLMMRFLE